MMTKTFPLRVILTITTDLLLSKMEDVYEILNWMTEDSLFTHQLPRASRECEPWLKRWFPELIGASISLKSLDSWIASDKTGTAEEGIKMWLTELKMMFPNIKDVYDIPRIPRDDHQIKNAYDELVEMRGSDAGVILIKHDE